jgi:hypothetical protein
MRNKVLIKSFLLRGFQERSSRSEHTPRIEMPREGLPVFRSARAAAGTDSARRTSARRPSVALQQLRPRFNNLYAKAGRPSIAPEKLLRALLLQVLHSVRSERMLMEQLDYSLLFRWFVGLNMDDPIWDVTVFTKNRQRLLAGDIADAFLAAVLKQARQRNLLSDGQSHYTA